MSQHKVKKLTLELHQNFYNLLQTLDKISVNKKTNFHIQESEKEFEEEFEKLLQSHIKLQKHVEELKRQQEFQKKIKKMKDEIKKKDQQIIEVTNCLSQIHSNINKTIHSTRNNFEAVKKPKNIELNELIKYSHKIARTMSAPANYENEFPQRMKILPPCPTTENWNFSILYNHNLDSFKSEMMNEESQKQQITFVKPNENLIEEMNFSYKFKPKNESSEEKIELFEVDSSSDDSD
eukprot:gene9908-2230_t